MKSMRILPLLAVVSLPGCDGTGDWLRGQATATAYAAPLASDTSVVTVRRVLSSLNGVRILSLDLSTIMPDGIGLASTVTGEPVIIDLASKEFRRFRLKDEPFGRGLSLQTVASPDGSKILFVWHHLGPDRWEGLRVIDVATGASRMIMTRDTATEGPLWPVAWTPAGDSVFASVQPPRNWDGAVKFVLIPAAGGTSRLVHTFAKSVWRGHVSLSPDGRWLLYEHGLSRHQQTRSDIYIIDVQRGGARPLIEHPGVDGLVGWLPGTDVVLFTSDRSGTTDLWSMRVANGRASEEPRLVRSGFFRSQAVGFADGALFYRVLTGSSGQAVINLDPQSGALLGAASPPLDHLGTVPRALAWSPDGQHLAATTQGKAINLHSMETGDSRVFWLDEDLQALRAEWAVDGKALYLRAAAGYNPTGPHYFLRLDLVTGTTARLFAAEDPEEPAHLWRFLVTPDGRSIILRQQRTLDDGRIGMKLVLRSLKDGSERELHRTAGFIPEFSMSADGTRLAFVQQVWEKTDSLFIMRLDGSQPLRSVASWDYDAVTLLGWLPAGTSLLASRLTEDNTGEEILRIGFDGSVTVVGMSPFRPVRGNPVQGANRSRLVLSPAGNRLAHEVYNLGEELWRMDGLHELFASDTVGRR
jgi:Tol biopolymer transport system component